MSTAIPDSSLYHVNSMEPLPVVELKELAGNDLPSLSPVQEALLPYVGGFENMWWAVWFATLATVLWYAWKHGSTDDN